MTAIKKVCMIGAGRVGRLHTSNLRKHVADRLSVEVLVDPNVELATKVAEEFGVPRVTSSLTEALENSDLDGVVITTPTFTHRDLAVASLEAGLAVHLEKPMAMNVAECRDIAAAAELAGKQVQLGFMRRFSKEFIDAAAMLSSGDIGRAMVIKSLTHGPGLPPAWANDIRTSNGMIAEVSSHDLDTVCWFTGEEPTDIFARVSNFKGAERGATALHFYDTLVATITFPSGAIASVVGVCPADYGYDSRVEVTCTAGMLQVGELGPPGFSYVSAKDGQQRRSVFPSWSDRFADAYVQEMVELAEVIDGKEPRVGTADGERAVALTIAGTYSILEKRRVMLSSMDHLVLPPWQRSVGDSK